MFQNFVIEILKAYSIEITVDFVVSENSDRLTVRWLVYKNLFYAYTPLLNITASFYYKIFSQL